MSDLNPQLQALAKETNRLQRDGVLLTQELIAWLDWDSFTVLVDLLFQRSGWQRRWMLESFEREGEGSRADFSTVQPLLAQVGYVRLVERVSPLAIDQLIRVQQTNPRYDHHFLIGQFQGLPEHCVQTPVSPGGPQLHVWSGALLAEKVFSAGLLAWLCDELLSATE